MNKRIELRDLYRLSHIYRWSIVDTERKQSVAEHSYFTALIAFQLLTHLLDDENGAPDSFRIECEISTLLWGLTHDTMEVFTADIPTPVKKLLDMSKLDAALDEIDGIYKNAKGMVSDDPFVLAVVKLADMIEAWKFIKEYGKGDFALEVRESLLERIGRKTEECERELTGWNWALSVSRTIDQICGTGLQMDHLI